MGVQCRSFCRVLGLHRHIQSTILLNFCYGWGSYVLCRHSYSYKVSALKKSPAIQHFMHQCKPTVRQYPFFLTLHSFSLIISKSIPICHWSRLWGDSLHNKLSSGFSLILYIIPYVFVIGRNSHTSQTYWILAKRVSTNSIKKYGKLFVTGEDYGGIVCITS